MSCPLLRFMTVSPITCSTISSSRLVNSACSARNSSLISASTSRSTLMPLLSISTRNRSISFISLIVSFNDWLLSWARSFCWARYISAQDITSASAYSRTVSKGIASNPVPLLNSSSTRSDFLRVTSLRSAVSLSDNSCLWPFANTYSQSIVQNMVSGILKPIAVSQATSNLALCATSTSACSNAYSNALRLSGVSISLWWKTRLVTSPTVSHPIKPKCAETHLFCGLKGLLSILPSILLTVVSKSSTKTLIL